MLMYTYSILNNDRINTTEQLPPTRKRAKMFTTLHVVSSSPQSHVVSTVSTPILNRMQVRFREGENVPRATQL